VKFDPLKLRDQAIEKGLDFDPEYFTDQGVRPLRVFMTRNESGDDWKFDVFDAKSGTCLGYGDTKEHAKSLAQIALHQKFDFGIGLPKVDLR
jgi:hypothetical protein